MATIFKWSASIIGVIVVVGAIVAAFNWERLVRLYNINNLFAQANIVENFSNMKKIFFWKPIPVPGAKQTKDYWPEALAPMPTQYEFNGETRNIAEHLRIRATTSLLVIHGGKIVHEEYFLGTKKDDRRISWSVAKSFLSAMFGIAVEEGDIKDLDEPVDKYVPLLADSGYKGVSIRNVLNMASGVRFNEDYLDFDSDIKRMGRVLALGGSMDEFAASIKERDREAGTKRQYISIDTHVIGMVLRAATGKSLMEYLGEKIWAKIGDGHDIYYLTDGNGVAFALGGLNMRARDFARFGQLFLNRGKWQDEQIIPEEWVAKSTAVTAPHAAVETDDTGYGYQWWIPPDTDDEYYGVGVYGQYVYINPKADVVVVKTAADLKFRDDNSEGLEIRADNIEIFRAIAEHYSDWRHPR